MLKLSPLLSDSTRSSMDSQRILHPWVDAAGHLPNSKQRQIFHIVDTQNFYHTPNHYADIVHPLISQPIIELCLQIPSYVLSYGGVDRALVRDAFDGLVPRDILRRTSKGTTTGYHSSLLLKNLTKIRELVLDGLLVSEGLLDKQRTESALTESSLIRDAHMLKHLFDVVRAETWLNAWNSAESGYSPRF